MIRIIKLNRSDCCNIWRAVSCEKHLYLKTFQIICIVETYPLSLQKINRTKYAFVRIKNRREGCYC